MKLFLVFAIVETIYRYFNNTNYQINEADKNITEFYSFSMLNQELEIESKKLDFIKLAALVVLEMATQIFAVFLAVTIVRFQLNNERFYL